MRNLAVEYNVDAFSDLSFAVRWQGRLSTTSNSANLMSSCSPAAVVENPAEKMDKCPLIGVVEYCLCTIGAAIQSSGVSASVVA